MRTKTAKTETTQERDKKYPPGPCIWCGQHVTSGRAEAGCPEVTADRDAAWNIDGDFGCDESPESNSEGTGDHARPWDVARWRRERDYATKMLRAVTDKRRRIND